MNGFETMVEMIKNAYISVYGEAKWNSLDDNEKHDAVMYIAKDFGKLVGAFESPIHIKRLEANMDTTTLIFVIIGAFTVSSWFMRLVDYLDGGNKRV